MRARHPHPAAKGCASLVPRGPELKVILPSWPLGCLESRAGGLCDRAEEVYHSEAQDLGLSSCCIALGPLCKDAKRVPSLGFLIFTEFLFISFLFFLFSPLLFSLSLPPSLLFFFSLFVFLSSFGSVNT